MLALTHYDDGKEKWQSHEVSMINYDDRYKCNDDFDFTNIYGYGEDYDEALKNFIEEFDKKLKQLTIFRAGLDKLESGSVAFYQVDCCKKIIEEKED